MRLTDLRAKAHDLLSQRVLLPFAGARQLARPATRPAMRAFYAGLRFRERAGTWTAEERREWMLRRLREVVRQAARHTTYYRDAFKRTGFDAESDFTFDDFARLPILEREDVHRAGRELISSALPPESLREDATGGSTGAPTKVWLGPEERGWRDSGSEHFMRLLGLPAGTRTAYLWGHHLDPVAQDTLRERYRAFESNAMWFDCFRLSADILERYHRAFERQRPSCVIAYAGALAALADHVLERGHRPSYPAYGFVTGAEKLWPDQRDAVTRAFGTPVHERYGGRDVGALALQLTPERTLDYTIDWAWALLEPETDTPESPLLVTKLHGDGMPMLRYRVGDVGRFPAGSRPGHPVFVLHEVLGRTADRIWLPNGSWANGLQLPHLMKGFPVREFMFLQRADYSIELQIVPRPEFDDRCRQEILHTVSLNVPDLPLRIVEVEEIPRTRSNKRRPVMSEVEMSRRQPV